MSAAAKMLSILCAAALAAGCGQRTANTSATDNSAAAPTEIETLPSDESDATPGDELANGDDEADANNAAAPANAGAQD